MKRYGFIQKLGALTVAIVFSFTTVVSAAPVCYSLKIPEEEGRVTQRYKGEGEKTIIHIQDAHSNLEAQYNLAKIIQYLAAQGSVNDRSGFIADKNADNCADVQEDVNRLRASASTSDQTVQDALDEQNLRNQQARMPVIGIEGAIGHVDVTPFREFPLEEVREKVAKTYVKEGIFTGSELAAVASRDEIALWGIEDRKLFEEDFRAFYNVARRQGELTLEVERIEGYLDLLKTPIFNEKLKQFDRAASEYEHNQAQLMRFLGTLYSAIDEVEIDLIDYIQLLQFKEAFVLERMITFDSVDTEIQQLAEVLTAHYKDTDGSRVEEIKTRYKQYLKNKSNRKGIASYLNALAVKEGMDQRRYPHLSKAIIYWRKYATVDIGQMMREVLGVSHEVRLKFAQNENEELLINTGEKIMRLKQLLALKALKEDVAAFRMVQDSFSINDIIHDIKRLALSASLTLDIAPPRIDIDEILMMVDAFYTLAEQRDEAMLANLIKKMDEENKTVGVLVAGGYHSQGIVDLLKKNTISYVNIMPAIDSVTNDVAYMDRMMGNIAPLSPHLTSHLNSSQLNGILSTLSPGFIQQIIERYGDDTIRETTDNVALAAQLVLENKDKDLARIIYGYAKKLAQQEIEKGEKEGLDWNQIVENIKSSDTCVKYGNTITTLLEPKGPSVGTTGLNIGTDGSQEGHDEAVRKIRNAIYAIAVRQAERRVTTGEWNQSRLQRELQVINKIFMNVEIDIEEDKEDTDEHYVFYEKYGGEEFLVIVIDGLDDEGFVKGKDQHGHVGLSRKQIYLTRKAYNEYAAARNKTESDPDLWEQAGLHNALRHEIVEFMAWRQWAEQEGAKEEYEYTPEMAYLNARQMAKDLQIRTGVNKAKDIHNFAQRKAPVTADSEFADDGIVAEEEKSLDRIIITISGRTIVLPRGESVTIGSSERYADPRLKNSFYFNFMGISRKHAMISYRDNGDITIENYSSDTQGVLIDGKAIGENKSIPISIEGETKNSVQFFGALNLDISREIPVKTENIVIGGEAYVVSEKTPLFIGINPDTKEIGIAQQREMQHGETKLKSCAKVSLKQDTEGGKEGEFKVSIDYFPGTNVNGGTIQNEKDGEGSTWDPKGFVSLNNRPLAYQIGAVIGAQAFNAERMAGQEARNLTRQGMRRQAVGELSVAEYSWIIQMKLARIERAIKNAKESKDKETQVALSKQHLEFNQLLKNVENPEYVLTEQDFAMLKLTDGPEVVRAEDPKMIKRIASQIVETKVQEEVVNFIKRDNRGIRVVIVDNIEFLIRDTSQTIYSDINDSRIYITRSAYDASMQEKGASNALSRAICKLVLSQKLAFDKGIQYSLLPLYMTEQEEQTIDERVESAFEIPVQEEGKILQENINRLRFPDQELTRLLEEKRDGKGLVRMLDMGEMGFFYTAIPVLINRKGRIVKIGMSDYKNNDAPGYDVLVQFGYNYDNKENHEWKIKFSDRNVPFSQQRTMLKSMQEALSPDQISIDSTSVQSVANRARYDEDQYGAYDANIDEKKYAVVVKDDIVRIRTSDDSYDDTVYKKISEAVIEVVGALSFQSLEELLAMKTIGMNVGIETNNTINSPAEADVGSRTIQINTEKLMSILKDVAGERESIWEIKRYVAHEYAEIIARDYLTGPAFTFEDTKENPEYRVMVHNLAIFIEAELVMNEIIKEYFPTLATNGVISEANRAFVGTIWKEYRALRGLGVDLGKGVPAKNHDEALRASIDRAQEFSKNPESLLSRAPEAKKLFSVDNITNITEQLFIPFAQLENYDDDMSVQGQYVRDMTSLMGIQLDELITEARQSIVSKANGEEITFTIAVTEGVENQPELKAAIDRICAITHRAVLDDKGKMFLKFTLVNHDAQEKSDTAYDLVLSLKDEGVETNPNAQGKTVAFPGKNIKLESSLFETTFIAVLAMIAETGTFTEETIVTLLKDFYELRGGVLSVNDSVFADAAQQQMIREAQEQIVHMAA